MENAPPENAAPVVDSRFRYVLLAAHRAEQLMRGAQPKSGEAKGKPTRVAMGEIQDGAVEWGYGPGEVLEPEIDETAVGDEAAADEI